MAELYESESFIYNQVPVRIFNHFFDGTDIFTPLHWHRNVEFFLVTAGRINMTIDGENIPLKEGDFCVVNSGELHSNHWIEQDDHFEGVCVQLSKTFLDRWIGEKVYFVQPTDKKTMATLKEMLITFGRYRLDKKEDLETMGLVFAFLNFLKQNCMGTKKGEDSAKDSADENIKAIINYIDDNYMEQLDLSSVAAHFQYSPNHLSRMFKEHVGRNFYQYLQNVRLMHCVEEMKEDENVKLIECALNHGFPNAKSFIQTFRKTFGCTPSEWMKQGKKVAFV